MDIKPKRTIKSRILSRTKNRTGFPGVVQVYNDYAAIIRVSGKTHRIGLYRTASEAYAAYCKTAKDLGIKLRFKSKP